MQEPSSSSGRVESASARRIQFLLPVVAVVGSVALVVATIGETPVVYADGTNSGGIDTDNDGLPDTQEHVLGTDPLSSDSDNDGFSDLEELARQSDPDSGLSIPDDTPVNVGLTARSENGVLKVMTAVYLRHTETQGFNVNIGIRVGEQLIELPSFVYLANADTAVLPGSEPGDVIGVLQTPYPEVAIHDLGSISFWSTVTPTGSADPTAADAIDLVSDPAGPELVALESSGKPNAVLYRPIGTDGPSSGWEPGQICEQRSAPAGSIGPVVEHVVESSSCELADSYCTPNCDSLAGSSFQTVDPLALLGG